MALVIYNLDGRKLLYNPFNSGIIIEDSVFRKISRSNKMLIRKLEKYNSVVKYQDKVYIESGLPELQKWIRYWFIDSTATFLFGLHCKVVANIILPDSINYFDEIDFEKCKKFSINYSKKRINNLIFYTENNTEINLDFDIKNQRKRINQVLKKVLGYRKPCSG